MIRPLTTLLLAASLVLSTACRGDADDDGFSSADDCNDSNSDVFPGAAEICNGIDDDCNGTIDDGYDFDGDGITRCGEDGEANTGDEDCDDLDPGVWPGAEEVCDGIDQDCNGIVDDGSDADEDGVTTCAGDCDDADDAVAPGLEEVCDGLDNDCDGTIDEGFDFDDDGVTTCAGDCDDLEPLMNPGLEEVCDGLDNDCDGRADNDFDVDGDGVTTCAGDCNDTNSRIGPGFDEACDGLDNDCDGFIDETHDFDLDGVTRCGPDGLVGTADDDCDDVSDAVNPGAVETCDGLDNNCDGVIDEGFDVDDDGVTTCAGDCDDTSAAMAPGLDETCDAIDNDCDGVIDEGFDIDLDGTTRCGPDGVHGTADDDCNDLVAVISPSGAEVCDGLDNDCDGLVDDGFDADADGVTTCGGDCDDTNPTISPLLDEVCDALDNDCDGLVDETFDFDLDRFTRCGVDGIYGTTDDDCDDIDERSNPGATETCDGIDENCDGVVDNGFDLDGDGATSCNGDCNDMNPAVAPGLEDICDALDNDCDGSIDEGHDLDQDGVTRCGPDGLYMTADDDCTDFDPDFHPGATEICDGLDNDCDGLVPTAETDGDGDSVWPCAGDCDDTNPAISPLAAEIPCNSIDDDCNVATLDQGDADGDGADVCAGDCDDMDPTIFPGAPETCDAIDEDCDGLIDEDYDIDFDGWTTCAGDCDDTDGGINPGMTEICNGEDDDCDGLTDEGFADSDGDGTLDCMDWELFLADCIDNDDNDGDGWVDCDDSGCVGVGPCPAGEVCYNESDDDFDGLTDCRDSECYGDAACQCSVVDTLDCTTNTLYYGELYGPDATDGVAWYDCDSGYAYDGPEIALDFVAPYDGRFSFRLFHPEWDVDLMLLDGDVGCETTACLDRATQFFTDGEGYQWVAQTGETLTLVAEDDTSPNGQFTLEVTSCEMASPEDCDDGWDNDFDTATDCADTDCFGDPACTGSPCVAISTVGCGSIASASTLLQGTDFWTDYGVCQPLYNYPGHEVVWEFYNFFDPSVTISATTTFDGAVFLFADTGDCDETTDCLDSVDANVTAPYVETLVSSPVSPLTNYFIVVDAYTDTTGTVDITVTCP